MGTSTHRTAAILWGKRIVGGLCVGAVVLALVIAWLPKPIAVDVAKVSRGALHMTVDEDGSSRVKDRYLVSAPVAATLMRISLEPGDTVAAGEVVAELVPLEPPLLDPRTQAQAAARLAAAEAAQAQARSAIARAQATLSYAEEERKRNEQLVETGALSPEAWERTRLEQRRATQDLASARFAAQIASAEVEMARVAGRQFTRGEDASAKISVTSPVEARVLRVLQESAGAVQQGAPLLELGDPAAMEVVVDVLTSDAVNIVPGAGATIEQWGGERPLRGHVRRIDPSAFTRVSSLGVEEQRVNVVIDLDEPRERWKTLGDGYRVEARVTLWQEDGVLRVPSSAVFRHEDAWGVFVVADGRAKLSLIGVGRQNAEWVQVLSGLSEGTRVVLHASDRVEDGVRVETR